MTEARSKTFQKLKPVCVALSQTTLQYKARAASGQRMVDALRDLWQVLETVPALDAKLADYVFFPLSFVFREYATLPSRATVLSLQGLQVLIDRGWGPNPEPNICKELLKLLTLLVSRGEDGTRANANQDIDIWSLKCFSSIFKSSGDLVSLLGSKESTEDFPIIGEALHAILTLLTESASFEAQIAASDALHALISCLRDVEALRSFLPGTVSELTKNLQSGTSVRRPSKVLVSNLRSMTLILRKTLGSDTISPATKGPSSNGSGDEPQTRSWVKATSAQVKLALANIMKLRSHDKDDVLKGLFSLCFIVLDDCAESLNESADMILETSVFICSTETLGSNSAELQRLMQLLTLNGELVERLKSITHNWLSSLPRVIQSSEENVYRSRIAQIGLAYEIFTDLETDVRSLDDALFSGLQDSASAILQAPKAKHPRLLEQLTSDTSVAVQSIAEFQNVTKFDPLTTRTKTAEAPLIYLQELMLSIPSTMSRLSQRFANAIVTAAEDQHLAPLWIGSRILNNKSKQLALHEFVQLSNEEEMDEDVLQVSYTRAVDILSTSEATDSTDWRVRAVALEILAYEANRLRLDFRPELVDALYPMVESIGSTDPRLRQHAMTCLNIVSRACDYSNAGELVVQNADYLINAIAIRFNTFDISPQSPQVLVMMIELCGPSLIPYLDDLVESVFSALASFHGYPRLVESLFSVLDSIVRQGSGESSKLLEAPRINHRKAKRKPVTFSQVRDTIKSLRTSRPLESDLDLDSAETPPVTDERTLTETSTPTSMTYKTVQSILRLSQHYLTQPSVSLRIRLLSLISTGCLPLSRDENSFLPLINDIWPVILGRLFDPSAAVATAATATLGTIFVSAGDFLSTRVEDEWSRITKLYRSTDAKVAQEMKGRRGEFTAARRLRDGMVDMFLQLAEHVRLTRDMEDEVIDLLAPLLEKRADVKEALESVNADRVWLVLEIERAKKGEKRWAKKPGEEFRDVVFI